jgi:hypothetical protein
MSEPEALLADLPEESPPPEVVLLAVRAFRYRLMAGVLLVAILGAGAYVLGTRVLHPETVEQRACRLPRSPLGAYASIGDAHVLLAEVAYEYPRSDEAYLHFFAWGTNSTKNVYMRVVEVRIGGRKVRAFRAGGSGSAAWSEWQLVHTTSPLGLSIEADVTLFVRIDPSDATPVELGTVTVR